MVLASAINIIQEVDHAETRIWFLDLGKMKENLSQESFIFELLQNHELQFRMAHQH